MAKNKLKKFAEMKAFSNVFECGAKEAEILRLRGQGLEAEERHANTPYDYESAERALAMRGHWHEIYFHNDNPIVLELGCGRGEYTVGLAKMFPDKNFIGIDIKGARMWAGAKEAEETGLSNVAFLRISIEMLTRFFATDEVAEIWITFADPQMKKATKRLTSTYFMHRYQQVLQADGQIHLKTDSPFLYRYTQAMAEANQLTILHDIADLYAPQSPLCGDEILNLKTHYEQQWLQRGLTIKYLHFLLPNRPLTEPDVEIEYDTYRSYGRGEV